MRPGIYAPLVKRKIVTRPVSLKSSALGRNTPKGFSSLFHRLQKKRRDSALNCDMIVSFHKGRFKFNTKLYVLSTESVVKRTTVQSSNHSLQHTERLKKSMFLGYQNS